MSFCSLIKGITRKTNGDCVFVPVNSVLLNLLLVWSMCCDKTQTKADQRYSSCLHFALLSTPDWTRELYRCFWRGPTSGVFDFSTKCCLHVAEPNADYHWNYGFHTKPEMRQMRRPRPGANRGEVQINPGCGRLEVSQMACFWKQTTKIESSPSRPWAVWIVGRLSLH